MNVRLLCTRLRPLGHRRSLHVFKPKQQTQHWTCAFVTRSWFGLVERRSLVNRLEPTYLPHLLAEVIRFRGLRPRGFQTKSKWAFNSKLFIYNFTRSTNVTDWLYNNNNNNNNEKLESRHKMQMRTQQHTLLSNR